MTRREACRQASQAILRFAPLAHGRPRQTRDESKKCPRFWRAWTLLKIRHSLLAARNLPPELHTQFGLSEDKQKYDYRQGGLSKWLAKIHAVKLAELTPARVQEWKRSFLAAAGTDPLALRRARISVNSLLRQARSLFG